MESHIDYARVMNDSKIRTHTAYALSDARPSKVCEIKQTSGIQQCLVVDYEIIDEKGNHAMINGVFRGAISPAQPYHKLFDTIDLDVNCSHFFGRPRAP